MHPATAIPDAFLHPDLLIERANWVMRRAHHGQKDKNGWPYPPPHKKARRG